MNRGKTAKPLRPGEFEVRIDHCAQCATHNSSLRHDEARYRDKALALQKALTDEFPFLRVVLAPWRNERQLRGFIGCFEVTLFAFAAEPVLVFSKLRTLQWPDAGRVLAGMRERFGGARLVVEVIAPGGLAPGNAAAGLTLRVTPRAVPRSAVPRPPSSRVQKRIVSGIESSQTISAMTAAVPVALERHALAPGTVAFEGVKPGLYDVAVAATEDVTAARGQVRVGLRGEARLQLQLVAQPAGVLTIEVLGEEGALLWAELRTTADVTTQAEPRSAPGSSAPVVVFGGLSPGEHRLLLQLRDGQEFGDVVPVFAGRNRLKADLPNRRVESLFCSRKGEQEKHAHPAGTAEEKENAAQPKAAKAAERVASAGLVRPGERFGSGRSAGQQLREEPRAVPAPLIIEQPADPRLLAVIAAEAGESAAAVLLSADCPNLIDFDFAFEEWVEFDAGQCVSHRSIDAGTLYVLTPAAGIPLVRLVMSRGEAGAWAGAVTVVCAGRGCAVSLDLLQRELARPEDTFLDLGLMVQAPDHSFEALLLVAPGAALPAATSGLAEVQGLVSFLRHSKFSVSRFFGYESEETSAGDLVLPRKSALAALSSYEIGNAEYLLGCVRCNRAGDLSLGRLLRAFELWARLAEATARIDVAGEGDALAEDEPFDENDFEDGSFN